MEDILQTFRDYYKEPAVRSRILEFLGGETPGSTTCEYITADGVSSPARRPRSPEELFQQLDAGLDICRSLWDRESLIAHLDVEYVNFDFPAEAYLDPDRTFALQESVAQAINRVLSFYGIRALHVLSGRGHHFAWRIDRRAPVFAELEVLGAKVCSDGAPEGGDAGVARAFAGLGLAMEFLARLVIELSAPDCPIPVEMTAVEVGPSQRGREMVSIDISEYADPLRTRTVRVPFSAYLKPWQQLYAVGEQNISRIGPIIFIPIDGVDIRQGMVAMRDPRAAARLAQTISAVIPDGTGGTAAMLRHYRKSALCRFHEFFHSARHDAPGMWHGGYDRTPLDDLPEGARLALKHPNDLLLRPSGMRMVVDALLQRGWHPRHIAGLIRSKFERDHGWGTQWDEYSPALRADFYARIFAGRRTGVCVEAGDIRAGEVAEIPRGQAEPAIGGSEVLKL